MVVVAVNGLATPKEERAEAGILDAVSVATRPKPLGMYRTASAVHVGGAVPSHRAGVVLNHAQHLNLDARLGHSHNLGEVGNASLVAVGADKDVANLGTVDHSRFGH